MAHAVERIHEETELDPAALLQSLDADPEAMPPAETLDNDVHRLRRQRDALGAVNLRAEGDVTAGSYAGGLFGEAACGGRSGVGV